MLKEEIDFDFRTEVILVETKKGGKNVAHEDGYMRRIEERNAELKGIIGETPSPSVEKDIKFMDENGDIQAVLPNDSELMNAIVGYQHDPETHIYNRAERRRIIKAAKEIEKMKQQKASKKKSRKK